MIKNSGNVIILHVRTKNHDHMMYASWDMEHERHIFLSFWTIFLPFTTLTLTKSKFWKNEKKAPGDIIILHLFTTNGNQMMYGSWDMERDRQNCFVILGHFWLFTPVTTEKIKICKIWKKCLEITSYYTSAPKIMITCCTVPEICCMTDVIFIFHFGLFFASLLPLNSDKLKFLKI